MAMIQVYANVGQRDVQHGSQPLDAIKNQQRCKLREFSLEILESLDSWRGELSFPILEPALRRIRKESGNIDRLVLTVTDQATSSPHHSTDTIHLGRILERLLPERGLCSSVCLWIVQESPHRYDAMLEYYAKRTAGESPLAKGDARYVLVSGGTPAANMALLYQASIAWGEACHVLSVAETGEVCDFSLARRILERDRRQKTLALAESWDLGSIRLIQPDQSEANRLSKLAHLREHMALDESKKIAEGLAATTPAERKIVYNELRRELDQMLQAGDTYGGIHVAETFWQAEYFRNRGQLTEMIGRLVLMDNTLQEWALRQWLAPRARNGRELNQNVRRNSVLSDWLKNKELRTGDSYTSLPAKTRRALIEGVVKGNPQPVNAFPDPASVDEIVENLAPIRELRNESTTGHGFAPVSEKDLFWGKRRITAQNLMGKIECILCNSQILDAIPSSPWIRIKDLLQGLI